MFLGLPTEENKYVPSRNGIRNRNNAITIKRWVDENGRHSFIPSMQPNLEIVLQGTDYFMKKVGQREQDHTIHPIWNVDKPDTYTIRQGPNKPLFWYIEEEEEEEEVILICGVRNLNLFFLNLCTQTHILHTLWFLNCQWSKFQP